MFSNAVVQTKVNSCNSAKKCPLQVVHTKAIAALTQFCDFFLSQANENRYHTENVPSLLIFLSYYLYVHYKSKIY